MQLYVFLFFLHSANLQFITQIYHLIYPLSYVYFYRPVNASIQFHKFGSIALSVPPLPFQQNYKKTPKQQNLAIDCQRNTK
jgi:hypothetical protein